MGGGGGPWLQMTEALQSKVLNRTSLFSVREGGGLASIYTFSKIYTFILSCIVSKLGFFPGPRFMMFQRKT